MTRLSHLAWLTWLAQKIWPDKDGVEVCVEHNGGVPQALVESGDDILFTMPENERSTYAMEVSLVVLAGWVPKPMVPGWYWAKDGDALSMAQVLDADNVIIYDGNGKSSPWLLDGLQHIGVQWMMIPPPP